MDRNTFQREIIDLVKQHNKGREGVEQLPEKNMQQLESDVYAHIDQLFSESAATDTSSTTENKTSKQSDILTKTKSWWAWLIPDAPTRAPAFALAAIAFLTVGTLTYQLTNQQQLQPLLDLPDSLTTADLGRYIEQPQEGSRALVATELSDRRSAFMAGVTQADLDILKRTDTTTADKIAIRYHQTTQKTAAIDAAEAIGTLQSSVERFKSRENTNFWLHQGYAVELVHLAARRSMADMNTDILKDALQFYTSQTSPQSLEEDVAKQYIESYRNLADLASTELTTPAQVQEAIDTTRNMKVVIQ